MTVTMAGRETIKKQAVNSGAKDIRKILNNDVTKAESSGLSEIRLVASFVFSVWY